jgi:hypothetical protein
LDYASWILWILLQFKWRWSHVFFRYDEFGVNQNEILIQSVVVVDKVSDESPDKSKFCFDLSDVVENLLNQLIPVVHTRLEVMSKQPINEPDGTELVVTSGVVSTALFLLSEGFRRSSLLL